MKTIIISIIVSLVAMVAVSQTNQYPNASGTIIRSGYTYKYDYPKNGTFPNKSMIQLNNASVSYIYKDVLNRDGTPMTKIEIFEGSPIPYHSGQSMTDEQVEEMIRRNFTAAQKATFAGNGKTMIVEVRVDTSIGKIADVYFKFLRNGPAMNIPVETYRNIELALKQNFNITTTAEGRRKNYIPFSWVLEF